VSRSLELSRDERCHVQVLAFPAALVFAGLYYVEDGLIHRLSKYIEHLPLNVLMGKTPPFVPWDASTELGNYARGITLPMRVVAQLVAFVVVPTLLVSPVWSQLSNSMQWSQMALAITIVTVVLAGYFQRRDTGTSSERRSAQRSKGEPTDA